MIYYLREKNEFPNCVSFLFDIESSKQTEPSDINEFIFIIDPIRIYPQFMNLEEQNQASINKKNVHKC